MAPKFVLLWTDAVLLLLVLSLCWYVWHIRRTPNLRANWLKVLSDAPALCSAVVMAAFLLITLVDSVHFRRALPASATAAVGSGMAYDTRTESLLDALLVSLIKSREASYSLPLAYEGFTKESRDVNGQSVRIHPRLLHGGAMLKDPASDWLQGLAPCSRRFNSTSRTVATSRAYLRPRSRASCGSSSLSSTSSGSRTAHSLSSLQRLLGGK